MIATIRPDSGGYKRLAAAPGISWIPSNSGHELYTPSWSPDGRLILYHDRTVGSGYYTEDLKLMRPDGSRRRFLWPMAITGNLDATWSPDGRQILTTDATEHLVARDIRDGHVTFRGGPTSAWSWQPVPIRSR